MKSKLVAFFLLILSFNLHSKIVNNEILLGQSAAFTGSSAELGTDLWKGANAYFSYINEHGGIKGQTIRVITMDDGYEGKKALANTIELIQDKHIFALFGYVGTPTLVESLPAIQKYSKEGLFLFSNFTGAQPQREKPNSDYVFNVRSSYRHETAKMVDQFYKLGKRRFGLFLQYDAYGRAGASGVQRALKENKLDVVAETLYQRGASYNESMKVQVEALIKAKADVIISVGSYAACAAFIRDARNAGFKGIIANLSFVGSDALLKLLIAEEKKAGKSYTINLINTQVVPPPSDTTYKLVKEYQDIMKKYSVIYPGDLSDDPKALSFTTLEGFLNAKVFVEVSKTVKGEMTREKFYQNAKKIKSLDVGLGKYTVSFNNPASQGLNVVFFTTINSGKYEVVKDWNIFR